MGLTWTKLLVVWLALFVFIVPSHAYDEAAVQDASRQLQAYKAEIERIKLAINTEGVSDEQLAIQRDQADRLRSGAEREAAKLAAPLKDVEQQLARLGAVPTEGLPESETIAAERKNLAAQVATITAAIKQLELTQLEAEQMLQRILASQRSQFLERIFKSDRTILNPGLWVDYGAGQSLLAARLAAQMSFWYRSAGASFNPLGLLILPLGLTVYLVFRRMILPWLVRRIGYEPAVLADGVQESAHLRLWRVLWGILAYIALTVFIYLVMVGAFTASQVWFPSLQVIFIALFSALASTGLYAWITHLVCSPGYPERRLIAIESTAGRAMTLAVAIATAAYAFGNEHIAIAEKLYLPVGFIVGQSAVSVLVMVAFLSFALLLIKRQAALGIAGEKTYFLVWFLRLLPLFWLLLAVSVAALFLGYIALAYFIVGNLLDTVMLAVVLGVLHAFLQAFALRAHDPQSRTAQTLRLLTGLSTTGMNRFLLAFRTFSDIAVVLIAIPSLMAMWTVKLVDVQTVIGSALRGFSIGNIEISPAVIAVAMAVLTVGIMFTRLFKGWLQARVLSESQLDKGVQDSLITGTGYAGYTLAAALALSAAGLDFSTLAIIAGALGVGIGFGLQAIVNNFISGLILLAERPVRVGDWIVTQAGEGIVKKINVRATEIETFDNSSIIIPNLMLITNAVKNWTLRDSLGRFTVAVGFVQGAKADDIVAKLESLAAAHPKVMRHPAPKAMLVKLSPNSIDFELGGQVGDVLDAAAVASDLRLAITRTFDKKLLAYGAENPRIR